MPFAFSTRGGGVQKIERSTTRSVDPLAALEFLKEQDFQQAIQAAGAPVANEKAFRTMSDPIAYARGPESGKKIYSTILKKVDLKTIVFRTEVREPVDALRDYNDGTRFVCSHDVDRPLGSLAERLPASEGFEAPSFDVDEAFRRFVRGDLSTETFVEAPGRKNHDKRLAAFEMDVKESFEKTLASFDLGHRTHFETGRCESFLGAFAPLLFPLLDVPAPDTDAFGRLVVARRYPVLAVFENGKIGIPTHVPASLDRSFMETFFVSGWQVTEAHPEVYAEVVRAMKHCVLDHGTLLTGQVYDDDWNETAFVVATCLTLRAAGMEPPPGLGEVVEACVAYARGWLVEYRLAGRSTLASVIKETEHLFRIGNAIEAYQEQPSRSVATDCDMA